MIETNVGMPLLLKKEGFQNGAAILTARTVANLGLPVACAMLMMESGGGSNIYGHDSDSLGECPGWGWGAVTAANYAAFVKLRDLSGRSNGVGPAQLTDPGLQDSATAAGGAWIPQHNMAVGFRYLHDKIAALGLLAGCVAYNGSGPSAQRYGQDLVTLAEHYKSIGVGTVVGLLD